MPKELPIAPIQKIPLSLKYAEIQKFLNAKGCT